METLLERVQRTYTERLKQRAASAVAVLRLVLTHAKNEAIAKRAPLTEEDVLRVLQREVKRHRESIEAFRAVGRAERVAAEEAELAVLREFLPAQLTEEEVAQLIQTIIRETNARGPADFGRVMKAVMERVHGRTDGNAVRQAVQRALAQVSSPHS